ncbi:MAG: ABC transporter ATP-binding protein [Candidatus Odinarchaeota archaeon]
MVISIKSLNKRFGERVVLDNLSLEIGNEIFCLLGPNGAGKTTLVNILCGLLKRDSGNVSVAGLDPANQAGAIRKRIGLVTQETALYEYLSAKENLEFHARFYSVPRTKRKTRIKQALELAQLEDRANDRVSTYSGGMKRRLALVRALIHDPEIIILDEPTLGIDVQNRNEIWNRILELGEEKTILVNTNYMDEADRLADRCAIIDQGKLVALDDPVKLKVKHAGGVRLEARLSLEKKELEPLQSRLSGVSAGVRFEELQPDGHYHVVMPAQKQPNQLLTEVSQVFKEFTAIKLEDLSLRVPTLDDVFLELTGSKLRD